MYLLKRISALFYLLLIAGAVNAQSLGQDGKWGPVIPFEIVPVAAANLPDGRLITWSSQFPNTWVGSGSGMTYTQLFDPATGNTLPSTVTQTNHDMFCPGINNLSDGRILSAGGTTSQRTSIYDPQTGIWSAAADMNVPRGYQGNVTLSDGSVFTVGGSWDAGPDGEKNAELWTPDTGWLYLPGIVSDDFLYNSNDMEFENQGLFRLDNHVWLWPAPNGKLFQAGPGEIMHWIDVEGNNGAGSWVSAGQRGDDTYSMKGTTVMFDTGKILKVGGSRSYDSNTPAKERSFVIDINGDYGSIPSVIETANTLEFARTMHNSTVLPNGEVLVTGGLDHAETFTDIGAALMAEIYNPNTNSWRSVAGMTTPRTYHSVAILMLDGRVFVGGGGLCDNTLGCVNNDNAEIYSPPYLFDSNNNLAVRPVISTAPATADYNSVISVDTDVEVTEFSLIRFSAATHSTNNEQRRIPLSTVAGTTHSLNIPGRELLPPGYYMLFALDANGVPSIAKAIQIGDDIPLGTNPNLVLDLNFDETTGPMITDGSQYGNNATIFDVDNAGTTKIENTASWGTGLFEKALETDGAKFQSNTIAEIPYSESLGSIDRFITVMAWVNRDEIINNASVFAHDYPNLFFGFHNSLYKWEFDTSDGRASCYAGYTPSNTWVHMAATYDGNTARLYANGIEICAKVVTGKIKMTTTEPNFSSFNISGFYERRMNPDPNYNGSGVTDELDGRIDELKVYNKVLSAEEIKLFSDLGHGLPNVPDCTTGTIAIEYKIGDDGNWIQSTNINANEGDEVFIRAKNYSGNYKITTPEVDGRTFTANTDFDTEMGYQIDTNMKVIGDGLIDENDAGQYVLTTIGGCASVLEVNVVGVCGPNDTQIIPEYRLNGVWQSGENNLNVAEGTEVMFSILPNNLDVTVTFPDGTVVGDDFNLGEVTSVQNGPYLLTSEEGCSSIVYLNVGDSGCVPGTIVPEYTIDGVPQSGEEAVTVDEGQEVILSILPDNLGVIVTLPNGSVVGDNYSIDSIVPSQSGTYTFTSTNGCTAMLDIQVLPTSNCTPDQIIPEYRLDGVWQSGLNDLNVDIGTEVMFSMLPNNIGVTVTFPDGTVVGDDFNMGPVDESHSGAYTLLSSEGCSTVINLSVGGQGCQPGAIVPEYTIDGITASGTAPITVEEGQEVILSMLPDGIGLVITLPSGTQVGDNHNLGNVVPSQSGTYTFTSADGCIATLDIQVNEAGCQPGDIVPEYTIDGVTASGTAPITVDEGQEVILSMLPDGIGLVITLPGGAQVGDNHSLGNVVPSQSGTYTFTSADGCIATLDIQVNEAGCQPGDIVPEYTIDGVTASGAAPITVDEGQEVILSMLPNGIGLVITLPGGTQVGDNHNLGNVVPSQSGTYTFTSADGCIATLDIQILPVDNCEQGDIIPEYRLDGVWSSGLNNLTVAYNTEVMFSMLPNYIGLTVTFPDGTVVGDDYNIGQVTPANNGSYILTSAEGCQTTINLTVEESPSCPEGSIIPEYRLDGLWSSGLNELTVNEGTEVMFSMLPNNIGVTLELPDGTEVGDNYNLGSVTQANSGPYLLTSSEGCQTTINLTVASTSKLTLPTLPDSSLNGDVLDVRLTETGVSAIYPNPTKGILNIGFESFTGQEVTVSVFDSGNRIVFTKNFNRDHSSQEVIHLGVLPDGLYYLVLESSLNRKVHSVLVQK